MIPAHVLVWNPEEECVFCVGRESHEAEARDAYIRVMRRSKKKHEEKMFVSFEIVDTQAEVTQQT